MKKLTAFWHKQPFSAQLAIVFMALFIIMLFLIQGISGTYLQRFMEDKIEESYQQTLHQTSVTLNTSLKGYKREIDELLNDTDFVRALKALDTMTPENEWEITDELSSIMKDFLMYRTGIRAISVRTAQGNEYTADRLENDLLHPQMPQLHREYLDNSLFEGNDALKGIWLPTRHMDRRGTLEYYVYTYGKTINDWYTNQQAGTGIVSIQEETLSDLYKNGQLTEAPGSNILFLTDGSGRIIAHEDQQLLGLSYEEALSLMTGNRQKNYLILSEPLPGTDWTVYSILNRDHIFRRLDEIRRLIWVLSILTAAFALAMIILISGRMTASIRSIVDTMNQVQQGRMNAQIPRNLRENELVQIADHFNGMMITINEQMQQIRDSGVREKNAELRALEAQINPHFIYNTLDSINWLAVENDEPEISLMLSRFAQILRYQIAKSNQIVTIGEELGYLEDYLFLQKARFMDSFEYVVDCRETVRHERIHKMIFQPFLENAVIHGIAELDYGGLIQVRVEETADGQIAFTVSDNGRGMSAEQIDLIFVKRTNPGNSIGVLNVLERLDLYYGNRYHINVTSSDGKGTSIRAVIPKLEQPDRQTAPIGQTTPAGQVSPAKQTAPAGQVSPAKQGAPTGQVEPNENPEPAQTGGGQHR